MEDGAPLGLYLMGATCRHGSCLFCGCCEVNGFPHHPWCHSEEQVNHTGLPSSPGTNRSIFFELFLPGMVTETKSERSLAPRSEDA